MNKLTLVWVSVLTASTLSAQEVISTQGDDYTSSNGSISYTIGEVVTNTISDGSNDLTQGFHQTNWNFLGLEDHAPEYEAIVFPNPTSEILNIKASMFENVNYTMFDALGKIVMQSNLEGNMTTLQVSQLAAGSYTLQLTDSSQQNLKTFKLVKHH